jgi:hypothetical protein
MRRLAHNLLLKDGVLAGLNVLPHEGSENLCSCLIIPSASLDEFGTEIIIYSDA